MSDLEFVKEYLKRSDYSYLTIEGNDIRFTYESRNYVMHIDNDKKTIVIEHIDSLYFGELESDIELIICDIKTVLSYTKYSDYELAVVSISTIEETESGYKKKIEIVNEDLEGLYIDAIEESSNKTGEIIEYNEGLNLFDERLFEENWLEDFNLKIKNVSEEDLFLIISTLTSYFYKATNDKWQGDIIDPFVISHALELSLEETKKYTKNSTFIEWYNFWKEYFNENTKDEYLKIKNKGKR